MFFGIYGYMAGGSVHFFIGVVENLPACLTDSTCIFVCVVLYLCISVAFKRETSKVVVVGGWMDGWRAGNTG